MRRWITAVIVWSTLLTAQTPSGTAFRIERLDPAIDEVFAPNAELEQLGDRFALTEGPVWVPAAPGRPGYLLFSDNAANVIYRWSANLSLIHI